MTHTTSYFSAVQACYKHRQLDAGWTCANYTTLRNRSRQILQHHLVSYRLALSKWQIAGSAVMKRKQRRNLHALEVSPITLTQRTRQTT